MILLLPLLACSLPSDIDSPDSAVVAPSWDPQAQATVLSTDDTGAASDRPNILVVIADDIGIDASACYDDFDVDKAPQPTVQSLCRRGVVFDRAWSSPYSSPTRANMLTGRDANKTTVGEPAGGESPGLPTTEVTLPMALDVLGTGLSHAAIGKWHLADEENGEDDNPGIAGFSHYAGSIPGQVDDYEDWVKVSDGEGEPVTDYATTVAIDDAISWIDDQGEDPWFMWLAFNSPHAPIHLPPTELHSYGDLGEFEEGDDPVPYYLAMVESMDTELGRLLRHIGREELENTWIIYVGDNGTWAPVNQGAYMEARGKGSLFEGGIHVPIVVVGPDIESPGRREDAIVGTVDVFSTVLELAGGDLGVLDGDLDSVSMLPYLVDPDAPDQRDFVVSEVFGPKSANTTAGQAITDGQWKYIRKLSGTEMLYDLANDPRESRNLIDAGTPGATRAYTRLSAVLDTMPIDTWWEDGDTGTDTGE